MKLKILLIAQYKLIKELGGPKVVIELGEAIRKLGHTVDIMGIDEINLSLIKNNKKLSKTYSVNIKTFLDSAISEYDIVDGDGPNLIHYIQNGCFPNTLLIARSVLFLPHKKYIKWPVKRKTLKNVISSYVRKVRNSEPSLNEIIKNLYQVYKKVDLINVSNDRDVELLLKDGFSLSKIISMPYGIESLESRPHKLNEQSKNEVIFLGTFDFRKGCLDIPKIFSEIKQEVPDATLTLLGCKGMYQNEAKILRFFPHHLYNSLKIVLSFKTEELPYLVKDAKVAIFPSYLEGFPFSVVEIIAVGIPVFAYDAPGASCVLPKQYLIKAGDWKSMAKCVISLIKRGLLTDERTRFIHLAKQYNWDKIAVETVNIYTDRLLEKRLSNVSNNSG